MFNPLVPDLSNLKNEDIDKKIYELMKNFGIAARSGQSGVCSQINILIEHYKEEQRKRYYLANKKLADQNKNLDDYINIDS